jgi:hypothetical protein
MIIHDKNACQLMVKKILLGNVIPFYGQFQGVSHGLLLKALPLDHLPGRSRLLCAAMSSSEGKGKRPDWRMAI